MPVMTEPSMSAAATSSAPPRRQRRPARVLFLEPNDDGTVGGSYQVLYDFVRHLDRDRYEPVVVFYQDNRFVERLRAAGVSVHLLTSVWQRERAAMRSGRVLRQGRTLLGSIWRRARFLRRENINLLHVNGTPQTGQDDWLPAARLVRIPAVATCAINVRFDVGSALQRTLMRSYRRVLPVSAHVARQLIEFGFPAERVVTIHPGIDIQSFRSKVRTSAPVTRALLGVGPDTLLVTLVGNVRRWKGHHVAIEAVRLLSHADRQAVMLVFAGATAECDLAYEKTLHESVVNGGLDAQVKFLGHRDDVPDLMAAADIVLHASIEPEPFGLVVVEGMALGRCVLASSLGGPSEILRGRVGATFSPASPAELARILSSLIHDPAQRSAASRQASVEAERFHISTTVAATTRVYDELLRD